MVARNSSGGAHAIPPHNKAPTRYVKVGHHDAREKRMREGAATLAAALQNALFNKLR